MVPTNTGIFLRSLKLNVEKAELSKSRWYPKRKFGVTLHFSEIIKLQFGENAIHCFVLYCSFRIIVASLSLKNAWSPTIFF